MNHASKYERPSLSIVGVILVILAVGGCTSSNDMKFVRTIGQTSAYIENKMEEYDAVGLSIALVSDAEIVWAQGFGWADEENQIPATADSVYMLGSGTKTLTTVALLKLYEQGLISLDQPAVTYLPDFSLAGRYPNQMQDITVRRLLNHHSGIPGDLFNGGFITGTAWDSYGCSLYMDWLLDYLSTDYPSHPPGEKATYCNTGFVLAGEIALRQDGTDAESYPEYLSRVLFTPLDMNNTSLWTIRDNLARGHIGGQVRDIMQTNCSFGATGGAYTTVNDMAKFLMMIINGGKASGGSIFLQPETVALLGSAERSSLDLDSLFVPGLGLDTVADPVMQYAGRAWAKNGSTGDYNSLLEMLPDAKLAVIVLTNSDTAADLTWGVVRECLKNAVLDKLNVQPSAPEIPTDASETDPSLIAGIYVKNAGYDKISDNGDGTFNWTSDAQQHNAPTYILSRLGGAYVAAGRKESISFRNLQWNGTDHFVMIQSGSSGSGRDEYMYGGYVRTILGEKITVPALPAAWNARQGIYVLDNLPWNDMAWTAPFSLLTVNDGMLIRDDEKAAIAENDTTAYVPGLTHRNDSSIRVIQHGGREKLLFGGYRGYPLALVPVVASGETVSGQLELFKTDWYRFDTVTPGQPVQFSVTTDTDQYALTLFDEDYTFISRTMGTLAFTAQQGSYFIAVASTPDADGTYTMLIN